MKIQSGPPAVPFDPPKTAQERKSLRALKRHVDSLSPNELNEFILESWRRGSELNRRIKVLQTFEPQNQAPLLINQNITSLLNAVPLPSLSRAELLQIIHSGRATTIEEQIEAGSFANLVINRLAIAVHLFKIPYFTVPPRFLLPSSSRESEQHRNLKFSGLLWLRTLGYSDAQCEVDFAYGRADVASISARIGVECGTTPLHRISAVTHGDCERVIVLPFNRDEAGETEAFMFTGRAHGRINGWADKFAQSQRMRAMLDRMPYLSGGAA